MMRMNNQNAYSVVYPVVALIVFRGTPYVGRGAKQVVY